jgi:hypothetical protein
LDNDPLGSGRTAVRAGETFAVGGVFAVRVISARADAAELAFRWTDRTRPAPPSALTTKARGRRLVVRWERGLERGSGIAAHEVLVDGRRVRRVSGVRRVAGVLVGNRDQLKLRLRPGGHRVQVVAVDRTGNRSRAATRRVRIP